MLATDTKDQVTDQQLESYAKLVYDLIGIQISPQKKALLSNRINRRLRSTGIKDYQSYYNHLKTLKVTDPEWDAFLQEITTHETYLFRDDIHWKWLREEFLPQFISEARSGTRKRELRILSAACSTGDEAFSIASCVANAIPTRSQWKIEIVGTDIGTEALEVARRGVYGERAMRLVPKSFQRRFFKKQPDGKTWQASPELQKMTLFRQHNLIEPSQDKPFDLVFLKNVLIYFDKQSKKAAVKHLRNVIKPGGLLLVGAAEGISEILKDFERCQTWLYRKPE